MEFLNAQAKHIVAQMRGMSTSQRLALGLSVFVLVFGMWGLIRWGGEAEWSPLIDQSLTGDQIQQVQAELAAAGIKTRVEGDRVLIQGGEDERRQMTAVLAQSGALPRDMSLSYASLIKDGGVFDTDMKARWKQGRALEGELSQVIRRFAGVQEAQVFIEVPQRRGFGAETASATASVHVSLKGGEGLDKARIAAIANFVSGAVRGLSPQNVKITDGSRFYRAADGADALPGELLDLQRKQEEHYAQKIQDQLRYIPGVLVNVHAALRSADEQKQEIKLGPTVVDEETSKTDETMGGGSASAPGVRPNQGRALTDGGSGSQSNREETKTTMRGERDRTTTSTVRPAGYVERITASVNIPRSYLQHILEAQQSASGGNATAGSIEKVAEMELPKIKALVRPLINASEEDQVVADWFFDVPAAGEAATQMAGQEGFVALAKDYGSRAGLVVLVLFSLFMVMRIARKAHASITLPSAVVAAAQGGGRGGSRSSRSRPGEPDLPTLEGGMAAVGEAAALGGVLVGHEMDENMVRTHQIVQQINQLVKDDPGMAAGIVGQWVQESN